MGVCFACTVSVVMGARQSPKVMRGLMCCCSPRLGRCRRTCSPASCRPRRRCWRRRRSRQRWGPGERQLPELEAEDRLAFACEKAPTQDPVIAKVRKCTLSPCGSFNAKENGRQPIIILVRAHITLR